jgi:hypothetical protein
VACRAVARDIFAKPAYVLGGLWRSSHRLLLRRGRRLVEPEVVATSPCPIKSRVPVCCGFGSVKMARRAEAQRAKVGARGGGCTCTGDALDVVSLLLDYASCKKWSYGVLELWSVGVMI